MRFEGKHSQGDSAPSDRTARRRPPREAGVSLIAVLVSVGIAGIVALAMSSVFTNGFKANRSMQSRADLAQIRQTIAGRLDCGVTLGPSPTCDGTALSLKDKNGSPLTGTAGEMGDWTISASCPSSCNASGLNPGTGATPCNQIVVTAAWPGKDALTGKSRNATPTNTHGATVATDLFGWTSGFCSASYGGNGNFRLMVSDITVPPGGPVACAFPVGTTLLVGAVACPAGFAPTGGEVDCAPGVTMTSRLLSPADAATFGGTWNGGWFARCCVPPATATPLKNAIAVNCMRCSGHVGGAPWTNCETSP
jgi:hypothetical protein